MLSIGYKRKKNCLSLLLNTIILQLYGCDCIQKIEGIVVDGNTHRPLSGVIYTKEPLTEAQKRLILNDRSNYQPITDSTGRFSAMNIASGFTCKPHMIIYLEKEGYTPQSIKWTKKMHPKDTILVQLKPK